MYKIKVKKKKSKGKLEPFESLILKSLLLYARYDNMNQICLYVFSLSKIKSTIVTLGSNHAYIVLHDLNLQPILRH